MSVMKNGNLIAGITPVSQSVVANDVNAVSGGAVASEMVGVNAALAEKTDITNLAPAFDTETAYGIGDYVTYNGKVYRCTTAHSAGAWNSSYFTEVKAVGQYVTAGRKSGTTLGLEATAEGHNTTASGTASHAEGYSTTASSNYSHAEGYNTTASNNGSHAEGYITTASGNYGSHAEGSGTTASGNYSHAEGYYTRANHRSQHVFGEYNVLDTNAASTSAKGDFVEIVGNGTGNSTRSNARTLDWSGNEVLAGSLTAKKINAVSNENLIRNWYFVGGGSQQGGKQLPINQRNGTITVDNVTVPGYSGSNVKAIDQWYFGAAGGQCYLTANGIVLTLTSSQSLSESMENTTWFMGKTITVSILLSTGEFASATATIPTTLPTEFKTYANATVSSKISAMLAYSTSAGCFKFVIQGAGTSSTTSTVVAVKLELGSSQTLAHNEGTTASPVWVLNDIPDFDHELIKCKTSIVDPSDQYANSTIVADSYYVRPNLLDNWYFVGGGTFTNDAALPVIQRAGMSGFTRQCYIIAGSKAYSDPALTTVVYTYDTDAVVANGNTVVYHGSYVSWTGGDGVTYYTHPYSMAVHKFIGAIPQFVLDRWVFNNAVSGSNPILTFGGIKFNGVIGQQAEYGAIRNIEGKVVTASVLLADGTLYSGTITVPQISSEHTIINVPGVLAYKLRKNTVSYSTCRLEINNPDIIISAVKLEFGYGQTLAHQDTSGKWIINEMPDYREELRKCQRYLISFGPGSNSASKPCIANGFYQGITSSSSVLIALPTPVTMRYGTTPTIIYDDISKILIYDEASNHASATTIELISGNYCNDVLYLHVYSNMGGTPGAGRALVLNGCKLLFSTEL